MITALLDIYLEVYFHQLSFCINKKSHFHCHVLVCKGTRRSFLSETGITQSLKLFAISKTALLDHILHLYFLLFLIFSQIS